MQSLSGIAKLAAFSLLLAYICEGLVEYVFSGPLGFIQRWLAEKLPNVEAVESAEPLKYVALCVGVGLAFAYNLDVFAAMFPELPPFEPWVGSLLTGLAVGRGSNFVHDLWKRYLKPQPSA